ncbi:MAG: ATP-dependent DNA helicase [Candidatus Rokubacteria bacterium]|nr:ATP-dependent DNA helicase [Candidatus Rokubacteria bacterium]
MAEAIREVARGAGAPDPGGIDLDAALRHLGYPSFRPGQREAVATLLGQGKLLLVAPTGGGKSLTYQLPASTLPGTTLVISPLVSLMHDQVAALTARGVPATFLAATLEPRELRGRMAQIAAGRYKLVYVAPERLAGPGFRALLGGLACPLVAVDEAHCISEWGHDFRPEYLEIGTLLAALGGTRVLACTATATPIVRDEIVSRLGLPPDTPQLVHGFARPNLALRAAAIGSVRDRSQRVDACLAEALDGPGRGGGTAIVYAPTRRLAEEEAGRLRAQGWRAHAYHAGLDGAAREAAQRAFAGGEAEIIAATNAFGMGIDRPDVRAVIHLGPPGSIEAYYQEVGRAGRDGGDAIGLLLMSPRDLPLRRTLLERGAEGRALAPAVLEHKWGMFLDLVRWIEGGSCRHDAILRYFGDEREALDGCGRCDVCVSLARGADGGVAAEDAEAVTLIVRKALSGVARIHGRFGLTQAARLVHGDPEPRLERAGLTRVPTFGTLRAHSPGWLRELFRRLVTAGWVSFSGAERPVAVLTDEGRAVMKGERPARLLLPPVTPRRGHAVARPPRAGARARVPDELDPVAAHLFDALRRHRLDVARREGVAPFIVASDRTLRDVAMLRPRTAAELRLAHGIGSQKAERYGAGFLAVVGEALAAEGPPA